MYTIIVPFYKGKPFLDNFFHQVLSQTLSFEKLIFINDGDNSIKQKDILKFSNKILYIDNKINKGVNFSVLNSLKLVETPFVKIMSIDDIFDKFHAENAINILKKDKNLAMSFTNPGHFFLTKKVYTEYNFNISEQNKIFNPKEFFEIYKKKAIKIFSNSVFFRTEILRKFLFCYEDIYSKYADQILNTLIAFNYNTVFLPNVDSYWTIHNSQNNKNFKISIIKLINKIEFEHPLFYKQLKKSNFFFDLRLNDFIKILFNKPQLINFDFFKKFTKFFLWKKFNKYLPTFLKKLIIYKFN